MEDLIPATDSVDFWIRFGHTDGGTIVASANYQYTNQTYTSSSITTASTQNQILTVTNVGSDTDEGLSGRIETTAFEAIKSLPAMRAEISWAINSAIWGVNSTRGYLNAGVTTVYDTVQLLWSTGDFESNGEIRVHGLVK